jgi:hypothetical protein
MHVKFWSEIPNGRYHSEELGVGGRDPKEISWEGVDWMHLAQDGDQWWIIVNTVMNLRVP